MVAYPLLLESSKGVTDVAGIAPSYSIPVHQGSPTLLTRAARVPCSLLRFTETVQILLAVSLVARQLQGSESSAGLLGIRHQSALWLFKSLYKELAVEATQFRQVCPFEQY